MFSRRGGWLALGTAWLLLVYLNALEVHRPRLDWVAGYFWPPVGPVSPAEFLGAQGSFLAALAATVVFDVVCAGVGFRMLGWLRWTKPGGFFGLCAALTLGSGLVGFAALALALAGLARPAAFAGMALAGAACFDNARGVRSGLGRARALLAGLPWPLKAAGGLIVFGAVTAAAAPEITDDALRFMLEIPRRALLLGRLVPESHLPLTWTPWLPQGIALPLSALANETAVRLLSVQAFAAVGILIAEWLDDGEDGGRVGGYAALSWLALLNASNLAHSAMTDMQSTMWLSLAAMAQFKFRKPIIAGLLWGGALGYKYQAGIFLIAALAGELLLRRGERRSSGAGKDGSVFAVRLLAAAAAASLVWPLRNVLFTEAVTAPFFMDWGAGAGMIPDFFFRVREWGDHRSLSGWLSAPFLLVTRLGMWDALLSPLLVAVLPLAFLRWTPARERVFVAVSLACWGWVVGNNGRYLLPLAPVVLVLAWRMIALVPGGGGWRLKTLLAVMLGYEAAVSHHWGFYIFNPLGVLQGRESREAYLARTVLPRPGTWLTGRRLARIFRADTRYYLFGRLNAHYWPGLPLLDAEFVPTMMSRWAAESATAGRLRVKIRQRKLEYLVCAVDPAGAAGGLLPSSAGWTERSAGVYREFLATYARRRSDPRETAADYAVYEFLARPALRAPLPERLPLGEVMPASL